MNDSAYVHSAPSASPYAPSGYDDYRMGFGMGQASLWDLIDRLTQSPVSEYTTCHFCRNFLKVKRRDGKPFEYDNDGYPVQSLENGDLVIDPYDGHGPNCAWVAARKFRNDEALTKESNASS